MPDIFKDITGRRGINLFVDDRLIADDELKRAKNIYMETPGQFRMRKTVGPFCDVSDLGPLNYNTDVPCSGLMFESGTDTIGLIAHLRGGMMYCADAENGSVNADQQLSAIASYDANPIFAPLGGKIWILPGNTSLPNRGVGFTNVIFHYDIATRVFTAVAAFNGAGNATFTPMGAVAYSRRMVFWNLQSGYEEYICFSDVDDPLTIGANALTTRSIRVGSKADGAVIACIPVQLTSVADNEHVALLILKERAAYLLTGEPNQTTDTTDFTNGVLGTMRVGTMNVKAGCVSHATVVNTQHGVVWLGPDNVWLWRYGSDPVQIGTKLRPRVIAQANPNYVNGSQYLWKTHAAYHDGFYRLALWADGQLPLNTRCPMEQYWLDLRGGAPTNDNEAVWMGPMDYGSIGTASGSTSTGFHCMMPDTRIGNAPRLLAPMVVQTPTPTVKLVLVDVEAGDTEDYAMADADLDPELYLGNKPRIELISKDYDAGDLNIQKVFTGTEVGVIGAGALQMSVTPIIDNVDGTAIVKNFLEGGLSIEQQLLYPDELTRPMGNHIQLKITNHAGFLIDDSNDMISFMFDAPGATFTEFNWTLIQGFYGSLFDLMDMVVGVLNTSYGGNYWSHNVSPLRSIAEVTIENNLPQNFYARGFMTPAKAQVFWEMIGFTGAWAGGPSNAQTGDQPVDYEVGATIQLSGVRLRVNPIPRKLS